MGNFGVFAWNTAQKKGQIWIQECLGNGQRLLNILFWPKIFFAALKDLLKYRVDHVIHMQALGAPCIIKAIRVYNKLRKKNVVLKIVFIDLPAKRSFHYFDPIKRLSKNDKKYLVLSSIKPLLKENQKDADFWRENCGISMDRVFYDPYPVRQGFYEFENKKRLREDHEIKIICTNAAEANFIESIAKKGSIEVKRDDVSIQINLKPDVYLITIILGSKPCLKAIYKYIANLIEFMKLHSINKKIVVFPYCSVSKDPLIKKLYKMVAKVDNYPTNLTIVPMSFQSEDVVASLYFRSDLTITRSAGQTAMELQTVSKAKFYVHTECNLDIKTTSNKKLLKGIPVWESGIAEFMQEKMKAKLINPNSFIDFCKEELG